MASHFSSIGFPLDTEDAMKQYVLHAANTGEGVQVQDGQYILWQVDDGIELWVQANDSDKVIGFNPHFSGPARMQVSLVKTITRPDESLLDGAFYAWANPIDDDIEEGDFPFVFDAPDFRIHDGLTFPVLRQVQLAAFAHELSTFVSEDAYYASQSKDQKLAAESFIPSGLFRPDGSTKTPPSALAIFTGRVLDTASITNPYTTANFVWAQVQTFGGQVDVVADPELLDAPVVVGGILQGSFWLSGRLIEF